MARGGREERLQAGQADQAEADGQRDRQGQDSLAAILVWGSLNT